jgi:hypothetical protein
MPRSGWVLFRVCLMAGVIGALAPVAQAQDHHKKHAASKKKAEKQTAPEAVPSASEVVRHSSAPTQADKAEVTTMQTRGPTRLDFDDRVVQGQGSKVGAVYLYDRKSLPLRSMVRKRENFRDQIGSDEVSGPVVE